VTPPDFFGNRASRRGRVPSHGTSEQVFEDVGKNGLVLKRWSKVGLAAQELKPPEGADG
jgi:hypothetical protein